MTKSLLSLVAVLGFFTTNARAEEAQPAGPSEPSKVQQSFEQLKNKAKEMFENAAERGASEMGAVIDEGSRFFNAIGDVKERARVEQAALQEALCDNNKRVRKAYWIAQTAPNAFGPLGYGINNNATRTDAGYLLTVKLDNQDYTKPGHYICEKDNNKTLLKGTVECVHQMHDVNTPTFKNEVYVCTFGKAAPYSGSTEVLDD